MYGKGRLVICGLVALALLSGVGCEELLAEPPAIAPLPTLTPSPVFSPTPPVVEADTPTPVSPTPTATLTPTPRASPTPLFGPTSTISDDALTLTALGPGARGAPVIHYFVATPDEEELEPGQAVVLFWSSKGANSAAIYHLDENGDPDRTWQVEVEGSLTVTPPGVGRSEIYVLAVTNGVTTVERRLAIEISCPYTWFFEPPPEACPSAPPTFSLAVTQAFERGRMFWIELTDQIIVILADDLEEEPAWFIFDDPYVEGGPEGEDRLEPPPGFVQPLRGFGTLWRNDPILRDRIGWAIGEESVYQITYQRDSFTESTAIYFTDPDGVIIVLEPNGEGWSTIAPEAMPETPSP